MNLPKLPYGMIDIDADTKAVLESLEEKWFSDGVFNHKVCSVEAFGIKDNILHIIGRAGGYNQLYFEIKKNIINGFTEEVVFEPNNGPGMISLCTLTLYDWLPDTKKRRKQTEDFWNLRDGLAAMNKKDIDEKIKDIRIFQGTIKEVERDLGVPLERVDTGKSETFIKAESDYFLRTEAYRAGADLIVHYQPGSSIGTPVKITGNAGSKEA